MTETAAHGYRPAARPAGGQPRPLYVVHDPVTLQPETEEPEYTRADHETPAQIVSDDANPGAEPLQVSGWQAAKGRISGYWTPPAIFTDQPASLAELATYARRAPWTQQNTGIFRTAGLGYHWTVAYPWTVGARYSEWVAQRPGRVVAHLAVVKLLTLTTPGIWVVDHIVYPAARLVGHILL